MDAFSRQSSKTINDKIDNLSQVAVDLQYSIQSDLWKPYNQIGYIKSIRDAGYHFSYLAESLAANDPALFLDYVLWAKVLFAGLKLPQNALRTSLECMKQALQESLEQDMAIIACEYIIFALERLPDAADSLESFLSPGSPYYELATNYLGALLRGDRHLGSQLILDAVNHGIDVKDIYLKIFQPCQQEIGRLWQMNKISVAQEHFCTAATQMVMSQLFPYFFPAVRNGHHLVATSIGGELHEIGIRMVADFLEMDGWDTNYLGANMPAESILYAIDERKADVVAISATITSQVSNVEKLINFIRSSSSNPHIKILVGGYPFNISNGLWQRIGADGYAYNAEQAVSAANQLIMEIR
jgi:MerR family transcriptional regulator, light-induced transcriptional regulator